MRKGARRTHIALSGGPGAPPWRGGLCARALRGPRGAAAAPEHRFRKGTSRQASRPCVPGSALGAMPPAGVALPSEHLRSRLRLQSSPRGQRLARHRAGGRARSQPPGRPSRPSPPPREAERQAPGQGQAAPTVGSACTPPWRECTARPLLRTSNLAGGEQPPRPALPRAQLHSLPARPPSWLPTSPRSERPPARDPPILACLILRRPLAAHGKPPRRPELRTPSTVLPKTAAQPGWMVQAPGQEFEDHGAVSTMARDMCLFGGVRRLCGGKGAARNRHPGRGTDSTRLGRREREAAAPLAALPRRGQGRTKPRAREVGKWDSRMKNILEPEAEKPWEVPLPEPQQRPVGGRGRETGPARDLSSSSGTISPETTRGRGRAASPVAPARAGPQATAGAPRASSREVPQRCQCWARGSHPTSSPRPVREERAEGGQRTRGLGPAGSAGGRGGAQCGGGGVPHSRPWPCRAAPTHACPPAVPACQAGGCPEH